MTVHGTHIWGWWRSRCGLVIVPSLMAVVKVPIVFLRVQLPKCRVTICVKQIDTLGMRGIARTPIGHVPNENRARGVGHLHRGPATDRFLEFVGSRAIGPV